MSDKLHLPSLTESLRNYPLNPQNGRFIDPLVTKILYTKSQNYYWVFYITNVDFITIGESNSQSLGFVKSQFDNNWKLLDTDILCQNDPNMTTMDFNLMRQAKPFSEHLQKMYE